MNYDADIEEDNFCSYDNEIHEQEQDSSSEIDPLNFKKASK